MEDWSHEHDFIYACSINDITRVKELLKHETIDINHNMEMGVGLDAVLSVATSGITSNPFVNGNYFSKFVGICYWYTVWFFVKIFMQITRWVFGVNGAVFIVSGIGVCASYGHRNHKNVACGYTVRCNKM